MCIIQQKKETIDEEWRIMQHNNNSGEGDLLRERDVAIIYQQYFLQIRKKLRICVCVCGIKPVSLRFSFQINIQQFCKMSPAVIKKEVGKNIKCRNPSEERRKYYFFFLCSPIRRVVERGICLPSPPTRWLSRFRKFFFQIKCWQLV